MSVVRDFIYSAAGVSAASSAGFCSSAGCSSAAADCSSAAYNKRYDARLPEKVQWRGCTQETTPCYGINQPDNQTWQSLCEAWSSYMC